MMSAVSHRLGSTRNNHVRFSELETDEHVEKRNHAHRYHEEQERGQLERVADDDPLDRAHHHVGMLVVPDYAKLQGLR